MFNVRRCGAHIWSHCLALTVCIWILGIFIINKGSMIKWTKVFSLTFITHKVSEFWARNTYNKTSDNVNIWIMNRLSYDVKVNSFISPKMIHTANL